MTCFSSIYDFKPTNTLLLSQESNFYGEELKNVYAFFMLPKKVLVCSIGHSHKH